MLTAEPLSFSYDQGLTLHFPRVDLTSNDSLIILGSSGSGKSTWLHLLCGQLMPLSGKVLLDGKNLKEIPKGKLDKFLAERIGLIFQKNHFIDYLTIGEQLALRLKLAGMSKTNQEIISFMDSLGVKNHFSSFPEKMSVGELQRASIARALISDPKIVFADEPTSALDDSNAESVMNILENACKNQGASLVIVTHDQRIKNRFSNQVVLNSISQFQSNL
jgi:ABC-type lipoprotein export system ATPase subunit